MKRGVLLILFCFLCLSPLRAQEISGALVRAEVEPSNVTPGQPLRLRITVLVPTWFVKPPVYPSFELPNAVTRLPSNSSFNINERIAGQSWAGIVRDYVIYPQVAARYRLTGESIELRYADPATNEPVVERIAVPPITFSASVPDGAEGLSPFLAATALSLEQSMSPDKAPLQAGDAIERRVSAIIKGTPAMFLSPLLNAPADNGIRFYPREPRITDKPGARGGPITGTREESALYVFERPGSYRLPEVSLRWWNSERQVIETTSLPAITLEVKPSPDADTPQDVPYGERTDFSAHIWISGSVIAILIAGLLGWRYARHLGIRIDRHLENRRASEGYAFRRVVRSLRPEMKDARDVAACYNALQCWLQRLAPGVPLEAFLRSREGEKLTPFLQALGRNAYGPASTASLLTPSERRALHAELKASRNAVLRKQKKNHRSPRLAPLYPQTNRDSVAR